ncbi:mucosal addressin cell adhesion molecule 1 [Heteronotia binoei]|uniref:mucosal addressin cell adhesion molecule 1 n=1 Tax=Heteronotia binoei TaxID=13085 RepID=UPI002931EBE0|nr:mucosal addressin cell adhesion molecule 1 [Heteronotia binoei]
MEGLKICTGQCQGKTFQKTVELQVYSLPDTLQLDSQPEVPMIGQPAHLSCLASHVYPSDAFTLSWFQGDKRMERHVEEEMEDSDLFTFRSKLEIPTAVEQTTYRCEARLQIGQRLFSQSRRVTIQAQETQEAATMAETASSQTATMTTLLGTPERPVSATARNSSLEALTQSLPPHHSTKHPTIGTTTASPVLESRPTMGRHPAPGPASTARIPLGEASAVSSKPPGLSSTTGMPPSPTSTPLPETSAKLGVTSKALPTTDGDPATELVSTPNSLPTKRTAAAKGLNQTVTGAGAGAPGRLCRPVITPFPPQGTLGGRLHITCHAVECHKDIQVQWVETPVDQSRYHQERAEGQSILAVDSVRSEHQGLYQCVVMTSQPRMASIRVKVVPGDAFSTHTIITIGAAGSVLGLFVASYISRRVWQRHSG